MKLKKEDFIYLFFGIILIVLAILLVDVNIRYDKQIKEKEKIILKIEDSVNEIECEYKYDFIDYKIAVYIESLCEELNVDSDLIFAILMVENPEFNIEAINRNLNNTVDCGLFQLNDKYIWTDFKNRYWIKDIELDPFNWKHNSYLAIHHIKYLQDKLKVTDEIIMAYNCGITAVMKDEIPNSTKMYLAKVKNNIHLLKNYR